MSSSADVGMAAIGCLVILFVLAFIIAGPFISIWALNTLFHTGIDYTFLTWLAALVVNLTLSGAGCANFASNMKKD